MAHNPIKLAYFCLFFLLPEKRRLAVVSTDASPCDLGHSRSPSSYTIVHPNIVAVPSGEPVRIIVLRESESGEKRVALLPDAIKKLTAQKVEVAVESGAGIH